MDAKNDALSLQHSLLVIRIDQKGQRGPINLAGRLDDIGNEVGVGLLVKVAQFPAAQGTVLAQIEIGPIGDPF